ncbi:MAG: hypothetical protein LWW85_13135 [Marinilabiliales bacterium]|nr:hypothetical protein [Marinilabiliales bacterium]
MWKRFFSIANHSLTIEGEDPEDSFVMPLGLEVFEKHPVDGQPSVFTLQTGVSLDPTQRMVQHTFQFEDLDMTCELIAGETDFEFRMHANRLSHPVRGGISNNPSGEGSGVIVLFVPRQGNRLVTNLKPVADRVHEFRFLLWMAFGLAVAPLETMAVHASVVVYKGKSLLFLGESGTGKSTHTRLWLKHILGSRLLNDDSPILRIEAQHPICYGSPWSGKGNVFLQERYPIAAMVRIRQAPENKIRRLSKLEAFGALYPSLAPAFACDGALTDHLCQLLSKVLVQVPVYQLDCLPDRDAALTVRNLIFDPQD